MRPAKTLRIAALPVALAALALTGCGGGGGSTASTAATTETPPALSKADLISQGDAICAEVNSAVGSLSASEAEAPQRSTQVAGLYVGMVESIERLGAPEDAAGYPEFLAAAEGLSKAEGEAKLAAEREDTAALDEATTRAAPTLEEFQSAAGEYGFEDCAEGPHAPTASGSPAGEAAEEGGVEATPEVTEEPEVEEAAPEEAAPETGGAGGGAEEAAPEGGGTGGGSGGSSSGGVGPG
jgi:hypothetical protein